jgi:hypothetical protein
MSFIIYLISVIGCATAPIEDRQVQNVIEFPGINKSQIYTRSLEWIATSFRSAKSVIELQDKESGKIIGNILIPCGSGLGLFYVRSTLTIEAKDNRARFTCIANSALSQSMTNEGPIYSNLSNVSQIRNSIQKLSEEYKAFILAEKKFDNW